MYITSNMQSGKIAWQELAVQGLHSCGRTNQEQKRPRFISIETGEVTKTFTKTETSTSTLTDPTETFTINVNVRNQ